MKQSVGTGARIGFGLAILALLVGGWLSYDNLERIRRNDRLVIHTHEVLDELRDTLSTLASAEASQRSYLITGDKSYLQPYHASADLVLGELDRIRSLTADNPVQLARLTKLRPTVEARLRSLRNGIKARDTQGVEGAAQYVRLGVGKREMNSIRALMGDMEKDELRLLASREGESRVSHRTAFVTLWGTTLLGLTMVGAAYRLTSRELETRHRGVEDAGQSERRTGRPGRAADRRSGRG